MATARASVMEISSASRASNFAAQASSSRKVVFFEQLSFSKALPCDGRYFSPHKMAAKITDYRDTAALTLVAKIDL